MALRFFRLLFLLYPLVVWLLLKWEWKAAVVAFSALALIFHLDFKNRKLLALQCLFLSSLMVVVMLVQQTNLVRVYPFFISLTYLGMFVKSLHSPKSILEEYAEVFRTPDLRVRTYLRAMTNVWCFVLTLNSLALLTLVFSFSFETWMWYSGAISYFILGALLVTTIVGGHIGQLVRMAKVAFCFFTFFFMCFLSSVALPFVWIFALGNRNVVEKVAQNLTRHTFRFVVWYCAKFGVLKPEPVSLPPFKPGSIVISNHVSLFDVLLMLSTVPNVSTFVSSKFASNPLLWLMVRSAGFIPVKKNDPESMTKAYAAAEKHLAAGKSLFVFPEGTRSKTGQLQEFKKGAFRLALRVNCEVHCVLVTTDGPLLNNLSVFEETGTKPVPIRMRHIKTFSDVACYGNSREGGIKLMKDVRECYLKELASPLTFSWNRPMTSETEKNETVVDVGLDHPYVQGHFENFPVFPAVGQLECVQKNLSKQLGKQVSIRKVTRSKFTALIRPPAQIHIAVSIKDESNATWVIQDSHAVYSKGSFTFDLKTTQ